MYLPPQTLRHMIRNIRTSAYAGTSRIYCKRETKQFNSESNEIYSVLVLVLAVLNHASSTPGIHIHTYTSGHAPSACSPVNALSQTPIKTLYTRFHDPSLLLVELLPLPASYSVAASYVGIGGLNNGSSSRS